MEYNNNYRKNDVLIEQKKRYKIIESALDGRLKYGEKSIIDIIISYSKCEICDTLDCECDICPLCDEQFLYDIDNNYLCEACFYCLCKNCSHRGTNNKNCGCYICTHCDCLFEYCNCHYCNKCDTIFRNDDHYCETFDFDIYYDEENQDY